jgi:hypothetical protein
MKLTVRAFTGMRPVVSPDKLNPGEAVQATNTLLSGGYLRPFNQPLQITALTSATPVQTIYRYGQSTLSETQFWFQSTNAAHFVKGPVDGDTEERTYFTGHLAYPAKTKADIATASTPYPTTSFPMGLQKPDAAPTVAVSGTATVPDDPAETVVYAITFVTSWGEEGPPSAASDPVSWRPGQTINLTGITTTSTPSYEGNSNKGTGLITHKRIYRSATGTTGMARYLLVNTTGDLPLATTTYDDIAPTATLGESMQSRYWVEPPDGMLGLCQMANGILAGYVGAMVCFSEPGVPYAWPIRYQQSVDAPVTGMATFDQSVVVSTTRSLYIFTGVDPGSITSERLAVSQTCVAPKAMVSMMGGVVFPTPDGLMYIAASNSGMLTDGLMGTREWRQYNPSSMVAYESDNRYLCFYDNGTKQAGVVFSFGDEKSFCEVNDYAIAGFRDKAKDALYLCYAGGGTTYNVKKWDADTGNPMSLVWKSGVVNLPGAVNFGVARVDADASVYFEMFSNGVSKFGPALIPPYYPFRMPAGYRGTKVQFELTGTSPIRSVEIAPDMESLLNE